ncbi:GerW family sporulation protein [Paenibacillus apiarius]|uniref:GerW family sporulation protein n=1 Tax=Paenibacillus apiarius TaxID=46240 RepID=A0ABT4DP76_9BACL|nr:GerW family sporulation protein [Paenibacillus apiarius]MBN3527676.1 GerW family sporulation protein [Paenibacillus apiarius]MCY9517247.1 GerW family sporulation protein [Paenibacillus apiarius]MCY9519158.1 GerW family sporulation protein [Paenibacillus apiarius]MCY9551059.1 GerW family sporulation protein [Paenibacillus apiarius]MCY9560046.1 GerW family sporulation protein [Paenibacillus apiarius]
MAEHPIEGLMHAAFENIKAMVDVNAIVGDPVQTPDGSVILPISRVALGFAAGGSDFRIEEKELQRRESGAQHHPPAAKPFGGGSGGGVCITPIAFLVVGPQGINVVSLDNQTHLLEKIIDVTPKVLDRIEAMIRRSPSQSKPVPGEDIILP